METQNHIMLCNKKTPVGNAPTGVGVSFVYKGMYSTWVPPMVSEIYPSNYPTQRHARCVRPKARENTACGGRTYLAEGK